MRDVAVKAARRALQDRVLHKAMRIQAMHGAMGAAARVPYKTAPANLPHAGFLLKECHWMCVDFMQERRLKRNVAAQVIS